MRINQQERRPVPGPRAARRLRRRPGSGEAPCEVPAGCHGGAERPGVGAGVVPRPRPPGEAGTERSRGRGIGPNRRAGKRRPRAGSPSSGPCPAGLSPAERRPPGGPGPSSPSGQCPPPERQGGAGGAVSGPGGALPPAQPRAAPATGARGRPGCPGKSRGFGVWMLALSAASLARTVTPSQAPSLSGAPRSHGPAEGAPAGRQLTPRPAALRGAGQDFRGVRREKRVESRWKRRG